MCKPANGADDMARLMQRTSRSRMSISQDKLTCFIVTTVIRGLIARHTHDALASHISSQASLVLTPDEGIEMSWTRSALLVSFTAATLAGVSALVVQAHEDGAFTTACYAALADDLTPLIDPNGGADRTSDCASTSRPVKHKS